jgi:hypothetical protein
MTASWAIAMLGKSRRAKKTSDIAIRLWHVNRFSLTDIPPECERIDVPHNLQVTYPLWRHSFATPRFFSALSIGHILDQLGAPAAPEIAPRSVTKRNCGHMRIFARLSWIVDKFAQLIYDLVLSGGVLLRASTCGRNASQIIHPPRYSISDAGGWEDRDGMLRFLR